jgi:hypothetical protein
MAAVLHQVMAAVLQQIPHQMIPALLAHPLTQTLKLRQAQQLHLQQK